MTPEGKKREKKKRKRKRKDTHSGSFSVTSMWKPHPAKIPATLGGFTGREKKSRFPLIPQRTSTLGLTSTPIVDSD
jgi:hypothetical protein